jgi:oxalate decarboxylase/phosphoglucose isomerase-like protein (cupin superfamily)
MHPNADEWNYWIKGNGPVTVFNTGPAAITANFHPGDIGYVKKALGHYVENTVPAARHMIRPAVTFGDDAGDVGLLRRREH